MGINRVRTVIEEAISNSVRIIGFPGIVEAAVRKVPFSSHDLQRVAAELEQYGNTELRLSAELELLLRVSNTDVLSSIQCVAFGVSVIAEGNDLRALAGGEENWGAAWARGIEPIKQAALQSMQRDVWNMDATLAEDSYTFQAAMVLLASEMVGPYVDRIATFLGYPPGLVQVMAARFYEARIWENDEVCSESWFDPVKGGLAFLLDVMVAEGKLIRRWSEEEQEFAYRESDIRTVSHFAV